MRRGRRNVLAALAGVGLAGAACWGGGAAEDWSVARGQRRALEGPPAYTGQIVAPDPYYGHHFLLLPPDGRPHLSMSLPPSARFERRDGGSPVLATGQVVSVWMFGPVLTSQPGQCDAARVVIEADGP